MTTAPAPQPAPDPGVPSAEGGGFQLEPAIAKAFLVFAGGFWRGETARRAMLLTLGLAIALIASTYATVQLNHWNRWFFDALERKDVATVKEAVLVFLAIIAAMAAIGVAIVLTRETLQVRWRAWLVEHLVARWLDRQRFYHLNVTGREPPNPEYRISDDTRWATEILVDLGIGLLSAVVGGIAFIAILWSVGGSLAIGGMTIPGYMVWLALAYGIAASATMAWVGKPLVGRVGQKNEAEGYFRFAMMRLRDNAESIALMKGGPGEKAILDRFYATVVARWLAIVKSHGHITWITNATGPMIPIVPLLFAAPKYLAGELSLGQVTQLAAAFVQVQIAISWVVDNYNRIAEWYASARRVMDIVHACDGIDAATAEASVIANGLNHGLALDNVVLADAAGQRLLATGRIALVPGDRLHITAESGAGKTTLARVLAGIARPSAGTVSHAASQRLMLLPQKAYLPLGSLRTVLDYPRAGGVSGTASFIAALAATGLSHLVPRLDEAARWDQLLSGGERQRLAIARVLLHRPDVVVLDEALSMLDATAQTALFQHLVRALPESIVVTLAQRPTIAALHSQRMTLESGAAGAQLKSTARLAEPA